MQEGHLPVLANEVIEMLAPAPGSLHIDSTLGGGGHTERILEAANPDGRLLDPLGVPTAAQGGVDVKAAGGGREHLNDLVDQHRQVPFVHRSSIPDESDPERILEAHMVES